MTRRSGHANGSRKHLREHVLKRQQSFDGSFTSGAEEASIPLCLAKFITMIIDGSQYEENPSDSTKTISIAKLLWDRVDKPNGR
jgi:hypothetical protein